jgi:toxin ParE1/3/4
MSEVWKRPQAEEDLINIWLFIAQDSPNNADRFLDRLDEKFHVLADNPLMGISREELASNLRSFPMDSLIIFYIPIKEGIEVIRVLNSSMDIEINF